MDLASRMQQLLLELRNARTQLDRAEGLLADSRAHISARDARLGGAHELLRAHHKVEEARRLMEEASLALEREKDSLSDRRPAH